MGSAPLPAASLQSDRKRNFYNAASYEVFTKKMNAEHRTSNIE
jgi:hypothetical protein